MHSARTVICLSFSIHHTNTPKSTPPYSTLIHNHQHMPIHPPTSKPPPLHTNIHTLTLSTYTRLSQHTPHSSWKTPSPPADWRQVRQEAELLPSSSWVDWVLGGGWLLACRTNPSCLVGTSWIWLQRRMRPRSCSAHRQILSRWTGRWRVCPVLLEGIGTPLLLPPAIRCIVC